MRGEQARAILWGLALALVAWGSLAIVVVLAFRVVDSWPAP